MKSLLCWLIIFPYLQSILPADICEETRDVFAAFGEEVTLQLSMNETKQIEKILWISFRGVHIATSRPGGSVEIREHVYKGRLNASGDGSLIIKDLKMEDAGNIKATIYLSREGHTCSKTYNLSVTGKCGETKNVSAPSGGNVTLQVEESRLEKLIWQMPVGDQFATTKPGGYIDLRGRQYHGRLRGSHDGSLTITNVSAPDQGDYRAIIFPPDGIACVRMYNVTIADKSLKLERSRAALVVAVVVVIAFAS